MLRRICKAESGEEFCTCIRFMQDAMSEAHSVSGPVIDETGMLMSSNNSLLAAAHLISHYGPRRFS